MGETKKELVELLKDLAAGIIFFPYLIYWIIKAPFSWAWKRIKR